MKQAYLLPLKRIVANEPQALITLKLLYNTLIDKINAPELPDIEKEQLLAQAKELDFQINTHA